MHKQKSLPQPLSPSPSQPSPQQPLSPTQPPSKTYNPFTLKLAYILAVVLFAYCYESGIKVPTWIFSQFSVFWIMCVYRKMNRGRRVSLVGEFFMGFWVRLGWATCYNLYSTGKVYGQGGLQSYIYSLIQTFISCLIYTSIPLHYLLSIWQNKYLRWCIFIFDQTISNGYKFLPLFQKQFLSNKHSTIMVPILIMTLKAISRPVSQIVMAKWNGNLSRENLGRLGKIGGLNIARILVLCGVNYLWLRGMVGGQGEGMEGRKGMEEDLEFFNICYYGFVGYLMNIETYTLE